MFTAGGVNKTTERLPCRPRDWHRPRHRTLSVATMRKRDWPPSWIPPLSLSFPLSTPPPPISALLTLCRLISITWSTSLLCQQFSVYFYLFCSEFLRYFLRIMFGRLRIADAVIILMCCVTKWCIHIQLAVVISVNVSDRSLAGLPSSLLKPRAESAPCLSPSTLVITEVAFVLSNIMLMTYCI